MDVGELFKSVSIVHLNTWKLVFDSKLSNALPEFSSGHLKRLIKFQEKANELTKSNHTALAGDYLYGPFAESAVYSGIKAAQLIPSI